jgi:hypothetical protein
LTWIGSRNTRRDFCCPASAVQHERLCSGASYRLERSSFFARPHSRERCLRIRCLPTRRVPSNAKCQPVSGNPGCLFVSSLLADWILSFNRDAEGAAEIWPDYRVSLDRQTPSPSADVQYGLARGSHARRRKRPIDSHGNSWTLAGRFLWVAVKRFASTLNTYVCSQPGAKPGGLKTRPPQQVMRISEIACRCATSVAINRGCPGSWSDPNASNLTFSPGRYRRSCCALLPPGVTTKEENRRGRPERVLE